MSGGRFLLRGLVAALGVTAAVSPAAVAGVMPAATPAVAASANGPADATANRMAGVSFLTENQPIAGFSGEFQRIRSDGANTVSFDVWWDVPSPASSALSPVPGITDSDSDLIAAAQEARQAGLRVTLTPKFVVGTNTWRGDYAPPDPATFFSAYESMVDHYADLAQQTGMSMLYVGSEMIDSDGYVDNWHNLIASARQHYSGLLSYEEDWREIGRLNFGDAVDVVSISAYFPISNDASPTLAQLEAGWHSHGGMDAFSEVVGQAQRWGKPIVFGEVGYEASSYAGENPCCNSTKSASDVYVQSRAYQALLDTFASQPWWGGVNWWAWNNGDPRSPEGKPAEGLIGARSVAFPLVVAPGGGGSATATSLPSISTASVPNGNLDPARPRSPSAGPTAPTAGDPGDSTAVGGVAAQASSGLDPQPRDRSGLVGLKVFPRSSSRSDHLGEVMIAVLSLLTSHAVLARYIAKRRLHRRGRRELNLASTPTSVIRDDDHVPVEAGKSLGAGWAQPRDR